MSKEHICPFCKTKMEISERLLYEAIPEGKLFLNGVPPSINFFKVENKTSKTIPSIIKLCPNCDFIGFFKSS